MSRTASILAVGSELLGTTRLDTNSLFLAGRLESIGIRVVRKACVGDSWDDLVAELGWALARAPLLVVTGGLGPTEDDRTKEAVASLLGRRLVRDEAILARLEERFRKRGREMPGGNAKQADVVEGAVVLPNRQGTAPAYLIEAEGKTIVLLPGVPREMKALFEESVLPHLTRGGTPPGIHRRVLKVVGLGESAVEELARPVYEANRGHEVTILAAAPGEVQLHFQAGGTRAEAEPALDALEAAFREAIGPALYGRDDETLEEVVGRLLGKAGLTVAPPRPVRELPGYDEGAFSVQDAGAQGAAPLLGARDGERVLDACAAPGGKTTHILELADVELTVLDADASRLPRVHANLARLKLAGDRVRVVAGDAAAPATWWDGRPYDRILLDVPCSATGVIRRHPDIKILRRAADIPALARRQAQLLRAAWGLLAPGGTLLYTSCSVLRAENEAVVREFLAATPLAADRTPEATRHWPARPDGWGPGYLVRPGEAGMDGFYYACLVRRT
mgnify:CR=1 FL=1